MRSCGVIEGCSLSSHRTLQGPPRPHWAETPVVWRADQAVEFVDLGRHQGRSKPCVKVISWGFLVLPGQRLRHRKSQWFQAAGAKAKV